MKILTMMTEIMMIIFDFQIYQFYFKEVLLPMLQPSIY